MSSFSPTGYWAHFTTAHWNTNGRVEWARTESYPIIAVKGDNLVIITEDGEVTTAAAFLKKWQEDDASEPPEEGGKFKTTLGVFSYSSEE